MTSNTTVGKKRTRRDVIQATAWMAPSVALAVGAPAAVASPEVIGVILQNTTGDFTGDDRGQVINSGSFSPNALYNVILGLYNADYSIGFAGVVSVTGDFAELGLDPSYSVGASGDLRTTATVLGTTTAGTYSVTFTSGAASVTLSVTIGS